MAGRTKALLKARRNQPDEVFGRDRGKRDGGNWCVFRLLDSCTACIQSNLDRLISHDPKHPRPIRLVPPRFDEKPGKSRRMRFSEGTPGDCCVFCSFGSIQAKTLGGAAGLPYCQVRIIVFGRDNGFAPGADVDDQFRQIGHDGGRERHQRASFLFCSDRTKPTTVTAIMARMKM